MFNSLHGRIDGGRRVSDEHNHYVNTKKRQYGDHYVECGYCKRPGHHRDFCRKLLRDDQERNAPRRRSSPLPDVEEQRVRFKHDGYDHIYGFEKREEVGGDWPYSIRGCEQRGDSVVWDRWEQIPIFPGVQSVRALVILAKAVRAGREAGVRGFVRNELLPKLIELYSRLNFECFDEAIRLFRTPTPIMTKAEFTEFVKTYGSPSGDVESTETQRNAKRKRRSDSLSPQNEEGVSNLRIQPPVRTPSQPLPRSPLEPTPHETPPQPLPPQPQLSPRKPPPQPVAQPPECPRPSLVVVKQEVATSSAAASPVTTSPVTTPPVTTPPVTASPSAPTVPVKTSTTISLEHPVFQAHRREIDLRNVKLYQELAGSLSGPWQRLADEQIKTNVLEARVEALSNKNKQLDESWKVIHQQLETSSGTKVRQLEEIVQTLKEERDKLVEEQKGSNAAIEELRKELEGVKRERDELEEDIKGMARLFEKHVKK